MVAAEAVVQVAAAVVEVAVVFITVAADARGIIADMALAKVVAVVLDLAPMA